jgi:hypothetical protein
MENRPDDVRRWAAESLQAAAAIISPVSRSVTDSTDRAETASTTVVLVVDEEAKPAAAMMTVQTASSSSQSANESRTAEDHKDVSLIQTLGGEAPAVWTDKMVGISHDFVCFD